MDIKTILKNPLAAIEKHWGQVSSCRDHDAIMGAVKETNEITASIKKLKDDKNHCSSQFKKHSDNHELISQLKEGMKNISLELKAAEAARKKLNKTLQEYFSQKPGNTIPDIPEQFSLQQLPGTAAPPGAIVILAEDDMEEKWDSYVKQHPNSSLYHLYSWRTLIRQSFQHDSYYFAAIIDDRIIGILPVIRLNSFLFGDFAISMPFFNYGGVIADSPEIAQLLLEQAAKQCQEKGINHLEVRATRALNEWPCRAEKVSMIRKLPATAEQLNSELGSKLRAQINRAKSENTHTATGGLDLLDDFYKVFSINMRDLGTPVYSKNFFRNILKQWGEIATVVVIYLNERPVATAFLLKNKNMTEIPWASTLRKTNPLSMNMLLYWEVLSLVITQEQNYFDFGRSSINSNTYRFKKQWGANPVQHYWHYWQGDGAALPELNPNNPKYELLISIWRKLPVALTRLIGPPIVKNLP